MLVQASWAYRDNPPQIGQAPEENFLSQPASRFETVIKPLSVGQIVLSADREIGA